MRFANRTSALADRDGSGTIIWFCVSFFPSVNQNLAIVTVSFEGLQRPRVCAGRSGMFIYFSNAFFLFGEATKLIVTLSM